MYEFKQYRRSAIAEMRPYVKGESLMNVEIKPLHFITVSVSQADAHEGSPKPGDMIARNPKNHADQWLVSAAYFADNFEEMSADGTV